MSDELERRTVDFGDGLWMDVTCPKCGRVGTLHFNGGELDAWACCGLMHELQHGDIFYVLRPVRAGDPPSS